MNAQADLSLCWAHIPFCSFCHEAAHFQFGTFCTQKRNCLVTQFCIYCDISDIGGIFQLFSFLYWKCLTLTKLLRNFNIFAPDLYGDSADRSFMHVYLCSCFADRLISYVTYQYIQTGKEPLNISLEVEWTICIYRLILLKKSVLTLNCRQTILAFRGPLLHLGIIVTIQI